MSLRVGAALPTDVLRAALLDEGRVALCWLYGEGLRPTLDDLDVDSAGRVFARVESYLLGEVAQSQGNTFH